MTRHGCRGSILLAVPIALLWQGGCTVSFSSPSDDGGISGDASSMADASGIPDAMPQDSSLPDGGPNCGDGVLDPDEECDDGNQSNTDACTNACRDARCGDGVTYQGFEECDDGNPSDTDACLSDCRSARCGDGFVWVGFEECDDGNPSDTDSCLSDCRSAWCGDGFIWSGVEACDDQNSHGGDGCTASCQVESGYSCVGQPSQCSTICGDGLVRGSEACDDGNQVNGDGCSSSCTIEALPALYWFGGGSAWSGQLITYAYQSHAPTPSVYPILAAAAASDNREAFVFTQTTYHVLDLTSFTWVDSGSIGSMFSGVPYSTATLRSAMGASFGTRADIYFIYGELTYIYSYDFYSGTATADSNNPYTLDHWSYCCGATVPSISSIKASWYDPANYRGWTSGSYYDICNPGCPCGVQACETGVVGPYDAHITTSSVLHIKDIGCCDRFYSQMSASSFSPFSASGAPMIYLISAAFYDPGTERLFVITDP